MLRRLLDLRQVINQVLCDRNVSKRTDALLDLSALQWSIAEDLVKVLRPFEVLVATTALSSETNVSLSSVVPIISGLLKSVPDNLDDGPEIAELKEVLRTKLTEKFDLDSLPLGTSAVSLMATILDPRFKKLSFLSATARPSAYSALLGMAAAESDPDVVVQSTTAEQQESPAAECSSPPAKRACVWDVLGVEFDVADSDVAASSRPSESVEDEVARYQLAESMGPSGKPLQWWKEHAHTFPRLTKLAKAVLCVPATSTPSERVFSASGLIASQQRASLKASNVDALVFLNKNMPRLFSMQSLGDDKDALAATARKQLPPMVNIEAPPLPNLEIQREDM